MPLCLQLYDFSSLLTNIQQKFVSSQTVAWTESANYDRTADGHMTMMRIRDKLQFPRRMVFYRYQLRFFRNCSRTTYQIVFDSWQLDQKYIMKKYGLKRNDVRMVHIFMAERRSGKTVALCAWSTATMSCVVILDDRPFEVAVFSNNQKSSFRFLEEVKLALNELDHSDMRIDRTNLVIKMMKKGKENDLRRMSSYGGGEVSFIVVLNVVLLLFICCTCIRHRPSRGSQTAR
jgi:hypothetical protein